ncbi:hypothetical protein ACLQ2C_25795 [Streptomyces sp. DT73]|jgi:hypothetical protein|uniref:hypothetical protein n=1 Tax=Streptomyces sp. DT190 TaxID=3416527 RepID=UPI003CE7E2EE
MSNVASRGAASPGRVVFTGGVPGHGGRASHKLALVRLPYFAYEREAYPESASRPT